MTRPEHLVAARLNSLEVGDLLNAVAAVAEPVKLAYLWRPVLPDQDDDMVLEVAVNGRADAVVTFNVRDFGKPARGFGIQTLLPAEAVRSERAR